MADFDGVIDPPAGWPDVPQLSAEAVAMGGLLGPMNAQAIALVARQKQAALDLAEVSGRLPGSVTFEQFGAGKGDDDAALESLINWLNAQSRGYLVECAGSYVFTKECTAVLTRSGVTFDGKGSGHFECSAIPTVGGEQLITARGQGFTGLSTTLTANFTPSFRNELSTLSPRLVVASTAGFAVGDYISVSSSGEYYIGVSGVSGFGLVYKGFLRRIIAIPSATVIVLDETLPESFNAIAYTVHVTQVRMLEGLTFRGLSATGAFKASIDYDGTQVGPRLVFANYVNNFTMEKIVANKWPRGVAEHLLGAGLTVRDNRYDGCFLGVAANSVRGVTADNITFTGGRRPVEFNTEYQLFVNAGLSGYTAYETVITEKVFFIGGYTNDAVTVGGHVCHDLTYIGTVARNVRIGIHQRGKHLRVVGCDLEGENGILLGGGSIALRDNTTYTEDPIGGRVYVDATTRIRAIGAAFEATTSWESIYFAADCESRLGFTAYCKHQSNAEIVINFRGTDFDPTSGACLIGLGNGLPIDASNIKVTGGKVRDTYAGFTHNGVLGAGTVSNVTVEGTHFSGVTGHYARAATAQLDRTCFARRCSHSGTAPSNPVSGFNAPGRTIMWQEDNTWGYTQNRYSIVGGVLNIESAASIVELEVIPTANTTVTSITGGRSGQQIMIRNNTPAFSVTLTASANMRLPTSAVLPGNNSNIQLTNVGSGGNIWVETGRTIFS